MYSDANLLFSGWSAVFSSLPTESSSPPGVIAPLRFSMSKRAKRLGKQSLLSTSGSIRWKHEAVPFLLEQVTDVFLFLPSVLVDDSAGTAGDLYIRSVRFSPDGKYLATGAEDKQVRVRRENHLLYNFQLLIFCISSGTSPSNALSPPSKVTNKKSIHSPSPRMGDSLYPGQGIVQPESGISHHSSRHHHHTLPRHHPPVFWATRSAEY